MGALRLDVVGAGPRAVEVEWVLNGGYAGRDQSEVRHHVEELAALGVPAPGQVPTLYPLSNHLVSQGTRLQAPHARCSGEAEWAMIVGRDADDVLLAAACDHTDRALEAHGVAWSKQSFPNMVGALAWRLADVEAGFDAFTLRAWVRHGGEEHLIQDGTAGRLLPPRYWIDRLRAAGLLKPGTLVMSGTIGMRPGVDQFADGWRVELADGAGNVSRVAYDVAVLPPAWE